MLIIILLCVVASSQCHSILYSVVTLCVWDLHSMVNACVQYPVTQFCFELSPLSTMLPCCRLLHLSPLKLIIERRGSKKCSQEIGFRAFHPGSFTLWCVPQLTNSKQASEQFTLVSYNHSNRYCIHCLSVSINFTGGCMHACVQTRRGHCGGYRRYRIWSGDNLECSFT